MDNEVNRSYVKIQTILQIDPKTIHEELVTALGPSAPSYATVARWAKRFHKGREDVNDHPRSASSESEFTGENIELIRQVIANDSPSTYDEILPDTSPSHATIERIIYDCLKIKEVTSRWVSQQLTHQQRVKLCCKNLVKFQNGS